MSARSLVSRPASIVSAVLAVAAALGTSPAGISEAEAVPRPCSLVNRTVMQDNFGNSLSPWSVITSTPMLPGHSWKICNGNAVCSDTDGPTVAGYYNRLDSGLFSLEGASSAMLRFRTRYQFNGYGLFQVFIDANDGIHRSLIADLSGSNPSSPEADFMTIPIPSWFLGKGRLSIQFQVAAGASGGDPGAIIDNVSVRAQVEQCGERDG
jgi:hypothetical protein